MEIFKQGNNVLKSVFLKDNFYSGRRDILEGDSRVCCHNQGQERMRVYTNVEMMQMERKCCILRHIIGKTNTLLFLKT